MSDYENFWPKKDDLRSPSEISLAPYGVLSKFSDAIYNAYEKKLIGMVTARYATKPNGDKFNFSYGLYVIQTQNGVEGVQIKIIEISVEDDGWYPAKVYLVTPALETFGEAANEAQLVKLLQRAVNTNFVKAQIELLLEHSEPMNS